MTDLRRTIRVGPLSVFFTNVNSAMALRGHSHFATVTLEFDTVGPLGFPAFADTYAVLQERLMALTLAPLRDMSNEAVANYLWADLADSTWHTDPRIAQWRGCAFALRRLELAVRGVPDRLNHADGFTTYTVTRTD
jgi:hypothetical protein